MHSGVAYALQRDVVFALSRYCVFVCVCLFYCVCVLCVNHLGVY